MSESTTQSTTAGYSGEPITIWAIADGRQGHWNQVRGLIEALARRVMVRDIAIPAPTRLTSLSHVATRRWPTTDPFPDPDLIIGAGHSTHLPMLVARTSRGGRAIVLLKPSAPLNMFDLCLIPDVQVQQERPNVVATRGAISRIRPSANLDPDEGIVLIGGPSKHCRWQTEGVAKQIFEVCSQAGDIHWQVSTSRRTPLDMLDALRRLGLLNVTIVDGRKTDEAWLPEQLARCGTAWVTSDSVSMIYECLTAGSRVGLLHVPLRNARGKMGRILDGLIERRELTQFGNWRRTNEMVSPKSALNEADRCADEILRRFFVQARTRAA